MWKGDAASAWIAGIIATLSAEPARLHRPPSATTT